MADNQNLPDPPVRRTGRRTAVVIAQLSLATAALGVIGGILTLVPRPGDSQPASLPNTHPGSGSPPKPNPMSFPSAAGGRGSAGPEAAIAYESFDLAICSIDLPQGGVIETSKKEYGIEYKWVPATEDGPFLEVVLIFSPLDPNDLRVSYNDWFSAMLYELKRNPSFNIVAPPVNLDVGGFTWSQYTLTHYRADLGGEMADEIFCTLIGNYGLNVNFAHLSSRNPNPYIDPILTSIKPRAGAEPNYLPPESDNKGRIPGS